MDSVYLFRVNIGNTIRAMTLVAGLSSFCFSTLADTTYGPNILPAGNFEDVTPNYVPWAGVDAQGNLHGIDGRQICVSDDGTIGSTSFGPSAAVADLNGDGKPDIVVADSYGFFWYYPNIGTPTQPAFNQGEVIPIWLGEEIHETGTLEGVENVVPRIQALNLSGGKLFDLVAGTYAGKLFRLPNIGSGTEPNFKPTMDRTHLLIQTRSRGALWCNYLAPCFTTAFNRGLGGQLDLVMGEGTYSANSIYLLRNKGSNELPSFDENHFKKIIPGFGLEQTDPVVIDWNNDGKPDVISGSRTGHIVLYLNNSDDLENPSFDPGVNISVGGQDTLGNSITLTVCDLTGNNLPNLLIGKNDGTLAYALNTGKLGAPQFTTPLTPITGVLPPDYHYTQPNNWNKGGCWGAPYELLSCVNPQIQKDFAFPDGSKAKYALKFSVWPVKNICFPTRYYPPLEDAANEHIIDCTQSYTLKMKTRYRLQYWVKSEGTVQSMRVHLTSGGSDDPHPDDIYFNESPSSGWTQVTEDIRVDNRDFKDITEWNFGLEFRFQGQSTFYISDVEIQEESE